MCIKCASVAVNMCWGHLPFKVNYRSVTIHFHQTAFSTHAQTSTYRERLRVRITNQCVVLHLCVHSQGSHPWSSFQVNLHLTPEQWAIKEEVKRGCISKICVALFKRIIWCRVLLCKEIKWFAQMRCDCWKGRYWQVVWKSHVDFYAFIVVWWVRVKKPKIWHWFIFAACHLWYC